MGDNVVLGPPDKEIHPFFKKFLTKKSKLNESIIMEVDNRVVTEINELPITEVNNLIDKVNNSTVPLPKTPNKGTGAGGAATNYYGKLFETKTDNETRLLNAGFIKTVTTAHTKFGYFLSKRFENKRVIFVSQSGLKEFIKRFYNIDLFRHPDEAYIFEYTDGRRVIKILEKKEQNVEGSVDVKLLSGPIFCEEYMEALENKFEVKYAFCVNKFLQDKILSSDKKHVIFNKIMAKHRIDILYGDDLNYFDKLDAWLDI
jgi:hypothetical protein